MKKDQIEECYEQSIRVLRENSSKFGFLASAPSKNARERNYLSVFGRDGSICVLGALASKDKGLIKTARATLETLAKHQTKYGQIPNYVRPRDKKINFWTTGCVDATLWWLLAIYFYKKAKGDYYPEEKVKNALNWLRCQEHPLHKTIIQTEASDWADLMPRSGAVLYSNVLWLAVKKFYKLSDFKESLALFDYIFHPWDKKEIAENDFYSLNKMLSPIRKTKEKEGYLSYVDFLFSGRDFDVYGNVLAIVFGLCPDGRAEEILKKITAKQKNRPLPPPCLYNPIKPDSDSWQKYMEMHHQNLPDQYQNGGIWPYIGAFYALALAKTGKKTESESELSKVAYANSLGNWRFSEWINNKTNKPSGMKSQSWNGAMFILACEKFDI